MSEPVKNNQPKTSSLKSKWYIVICTIGREDIIKERLINKIENAKQQNIICDVVILKDNIASPKTKKIAWKNIYPGYIFVDMIMEDDAWFLIRNTEGVKGFLGSSGKGRKPFPLSHKDVVNLKEKVKKMEFRNKAGSKNGGPQIDFQIGDYVKIIGTAFDQSEGPVVEINHAKCLASIKIEFFGRETVVKVPFDNCKKFTP